MDINNNYSYVRISFPNFFKAYDIDYDRTDRVIYWVNNKLNSGSIFGMNVTSVRSLNIHTVAYGIAVDSISRLLFYTDLGNHIIAAISLEDYSQKTVISSGLVSPRAIVIDPINGTIYWVDSGSPAKIEKSNYDGTNRQEVVNTGLTSPYGLDVDINGGVMYWCDGNMFRIERANVDGSNRSLIYQEQVLVYGCSISLYQSYLYFTKWWNSTTNNFILAIDESKIFVHRINMDNYSYARIPIQNGNLLYAIEYDPINAAMLWTDLNYRQINSGYIYGDNQKTLRDFRYYAVLKGIAVDFISRLLFYTDSGGNIISVISLDKNITKTVISDALNTPQAIMTDPTKGMIYWSNLNKIEKSNYDGSNRQEVINTGLNANVDLAVDINVGVMYWCHYNTREIEAANVDGSHRKVLYQDPTSIYKCSIALHESYLYYIDSAQSALMRIATDGSGMTSVGPSIFHNVMDIHLHSNSSMIQGVNGCSNNSGGCSHFCFPQPGGSKVCDCPNNMTLQPDGLSCGNYTVPVHFLLITDPGYRGIYILDISNYRFATIDLEYYPNAVTYDPINKNIYLTNWRLQPIIILSIYGDIQRQLYIDVPAEEIALDVLSRVLFYSDKRNIAALSMDGSLHKIVIRNNSGYILAIALDPINGTIFWTALGNNSKIEKSNYDGTNRQELINSGLVNPTGLTIDIRGIGRLYWCDTASVIERANVDGTNRQLIYQGQFYKIVFYQSHLYITENSYRWSLMRIGTDGSNPVHVGPSLFGYSTDIYLQSNESGSLGPNGCSIGNGGCSHFCFPRPGGLKVCDCPDGLTIRSDGYTCRSCE
ncbi:hypothetical protein ACJMK2_022963 [Sinanodonta woodiana]|uniref:Uncharacterized protein n=1 Tax=Sinanodonta woodiana TaxID=1069815 RepID=A0ABD3TKK3_SINWO